MKLVIAFAKFICCSWLLFFQNYTLSVSVFDATDPNIRATESIVVDVEPSDLIARIKGMRTILKNFIAIYFVTKPEMSAVSRRQPA